MRTRKALILVLSCCAFACTTATKNGGGSSYSDATNSTDTTSGAELPTGKPGKLDLNCSSTASQLISPDSCRDICLGDSAFQTFLACVPNGKNGCLDISPMAPNCKPFSGKCTCDALTAGFECHQCPNGGVNLTLPDRKFYAIEAVTAFPAKIDATGQVIGRVCGAPLDAADPSLPAEPGPAEANGFEVTANFMSSSLSHPACPEDMDLSIKDGERINLQAVTTSGAASVVPGNFQFAVRCVGLQTDQAPCGSAAQTIDAASVGYKNIAGRCDPAKAEATRLNVALVLDNSGSTKGMVDKGTFKEDAEGFFKPDANLSELASDWSGWRFNRAQDFVDALNSNDRVVGYLFDENGPRIASSDSFYCTGDGDPAFDPKFENAPCRPELVETCPAPGTCIQEPTQTNDSYNVGLAAAECLAFGSSKATRADLANGLDLHRNGATGRSSLWKTVDNAFQFLASGGENCPTGAFGPLSAMHIVVVTDGPDTCVDSDDFSYVSLKDPTIGKCRTKCATSDVKWKETLIKMAKLKYPVHVHFVQFQAPGYKTPDPRMMEMACRTDGTYQFINSESFNKSAPQEFSDALARAVNRVRNGLSGSWRVGYKWTSISTESEFPKGAIRAIDGDFVFADSKFASLDPAVHALSPQSWRFTFSGQEDRRVLMRTACTSDADCGGSSSCSASHCGEGGVCVTDTAPNGEPCGTGGTCRNGLCTAGQKCADSIKP